MSVSLADVELQARMLSPDDRAKLAELLLESLQGTAVSDIEAEWRQEVEDRVAAYDRGETQTYSAEEVFAEAKRIAR
jgi:putative addiction module component (TIGR02574 family)